MCCIKHLYCGCSGAARLKFRVGYNSLSFLPLAYESGGAAALPDSGKTIICREIGKFFGQKPAAKNGKKIY